MKARFSRWGLRDVVVKPNATTQQLDRLRRDNQGLAERLRQAETIIEVQKKVSEILGLTTPTSQSESSEQKH